MESEQKYITKYVLIMLAHATGLVGLCNRRLNHKQTFSSRGHILPLYQNQPKQSKAELVVMSGERYAGYLVSNPGREGRQRRSGRHANGDSGQQQLAQLGIQNTEAFCHAERHESELSTLLSSVAA